MGEKATNSRGRRDQIGAKDRSSQAVIRSVELYISFNHPVPNEAHATCRETNREQGTTRPSKVSTHICGHVLPLGVVNLPSRGVMRERSTGCCAGETDAKQQRTAKNSRCTEKDPQTNLVTEEFIITRDRALSGDLLDSHHQETTTAEI